VIVGSAVFHYSASTVVLDCCSASIKVMNRGCCVARFGDVWCSCRTRSVYVACFSLCGDVHAYGRPCLRVMAFSALTTRELRWLERCDEI
jgi:hypothetical protein